MGYKLLASSQSERDTEKIIQYYIEIKPRLAKEFLGELKAIRKFIQKNPKKIQVRYADIRIAFLKKFPVGVHFKIIEDTVMILSILGTSEDSEKWNSLT